MGGGWGTSAATTSLPLCNTQFGCHPIFNVTQTENVNTIPRSVFIISSFFGSLRMEEIIWRTPHHWMNTNKFNVTVTWESPNTRIYFSSSLNWIIILFRRLFSQIHSINRKGMEFFATATSHTARSRKPDLVANKRTWGCCCWQSPTTGYKKYATKQHFCNFILYPPTDALSQILLLLQHNSLSTRSLELKNWSFDPHLAPLHSMLFSGRTLS